MLNLTIFMVSFILTWFYMGVLKYVYMGRSNELHPISVASSYAVLVTTILVFVLFITGVYYYGI